MAKCGVYKITCLSNDKIYIGSSKDISNRFRQHKYLLKKYKHDNKFLQNDWNKYGESNFKFEILEECNEEDRFNLEQKYFDELEPFWDYGNGYNIQKHAMEVYTGERIFIHQPDEKDGRGYIYKGFHSPKMPIIDKHLKKTRKELLDEYEGWTTLRDLWNDMLACNPDLEEW